MKKPVLVGILIVAAILGIMVYGSLSLSAHRVEVCINFKGVLNCKTARGATQEDAIRTAQSKYPLDFTRNPYSLSASFSMPIFNGWRREQQIEQASVQRRNAQNDVRAQELRVTADVTSAYLSLSTAQQTVVLQEQNVRTARTALSLAQERYRVGAISIVDLVQARGDYERAETDRITAIYDVQRAFAALENAVGRPIR